MATAVLRHGYALKCLAMIFYSHFSNCSFICCTNALLSMMRSVLYFVMGILSSYSIHINNVYQVCIYTCVDSATITVMTTSQVIYL